MLRYYVYLLSNTRHTVLYVGVTSNLVKRVFEHKQKLADGFTKRYNIDQLVYYEIYEDPQTAIAREKTIKNMLRIKKEALINAFNAPWKDLTATIS